MPEAMLYASATIIMQTSVRNKFAWLAFVMMCPHRVYSDGPGWEVDSTVLLRSSGAVTVGHRGETRETRVQ